MPTLKNPTSAQRAIIKAGRKALDTVKIPLEGGLELDDFSREKMADPVGLDAEGGIDSKDTL